MSYCRLSEPNCDVYFYAASPGDHFRCCGCNLGADFEKFTTPMAAIRHLEAHRDAGDGVPERAFALLLADTEHGPPWSNGVGPRPSLLMGAALVGSKP